MASDHELRQLIIDENIPKLVKSLTGFNESDENFKLCEDYAFSRVACHRYLSVNGHEIRRRVDGLAERFMADNYTVYGERLQKLVQDFVTDPLCTEHYEYDVHWSVLHFLLETSKNPVAALAENKNRTTPDDETVSEEEMQKQQQKEKIMNELIASLMMHNIPEQRKAKVQAEESDLSDWSDDDDNADEEQIDVNSSSNTDFLLAIPAADSTNISEPSFRLKLNPPVPSHLKPPQKPLSYIDFDYSKSAEWREKNIQSSYWLKKTTQVNVKSDYQTAADACQMYQKSLASAGGGIMKVDTVSTLPEWCLLREIIWMLQLEPQESLSEPIKVDKCSKFFAIDCDAAKIVVNRNVSLASVTIYGMQTILHEFAEIMTILYRFRKFFQSIFHPNVTEPDENGESDNTLVPHTLECYANGLKDFLRTLSQRLTKIEARIIQQDPMEIETIIKLYNELLPDFRMVQELYDIHTKVYVDFKANAGHVCVAFLLASLIHEMDTAPTVHRLNMASSLLLVSIRFYLFLFNTWWNEGQFHDWQHEFLVQKCLDQKPLLHPTANVYQLRSIPHGITTPEKMAVIRDRIKESEIIQLLSGESIEAGYILNILYNLDKLSEMKEQQFDSLQTGEFCEIFNGSFWTEVNKFDKKLVPVYDEEEDEGAVVDENDVSADNMEASHTESSDYVSIFGKGDLDDKDINNQWFQDAVGDSNPLLCMVFEQCMINGVENNDGDKANEVSSEMDCFGIYKRLTEITNFPMPLSIVIQKCLQKILRSRVSVANKYVLRIFLDEYRVLDHIANLQRVFLFGAGDLMTTFYSNLFESMKSGGDWNNSYLLTVQLDNILTTKFSKMHSLFSVQVTATDSHIKESLDAIGDLTINYAVRDSIRDIIHDKCLVRYNAVFRFLMQIKWAIWTLETLRFPVVFKKRQPYQQITLIDLIFRRLAMVRNWIIYSVQCVHSHLMTFVIQSMGQQFLKKMEKVECLREIIELHDSYIDTIYVHCFQKSSDAALRNGFVQLLNLVVILQYEWNNLYKKVECADCIDGNDEDGEFNFKTASEQVDIVESTYINCHCCIAEVLSKEVYTKDRTDLGSLSAAFTCSCPY